MIIFGHFNCPEALLISFYFIMVLWNPINAWLMKWVAHLILNKWSNLLKGNSEVLEPRLTICATTAKVPDDDVDQCYLLKIASSDSHQNDHLRIKWYVHDMESDHYWFQCSWPQQTLFRSLFCKVNSSKFTLCWQYCNS